MHRKIIRGQMSCIQLNSAIFVYIYARSRCFYPKWLIKEEQKHFVKEPTIFDQKYSKIVKYYKCKTAVFYVNINM